MSTPKYDRRRQQFKEGLLDVEDLLNDLSTLEERLADEKRHSSTLDFTLTELREKNVQFLQKARNEVAELHKDVRTAMSSFSEALNERRRYATALVVVRDALKDLPTAKTSSIQAMLGLINSVLQL